jgi:hypothetical protein
MRLGLICCWVASRFAIFAEEGQALYDSADFIQPSSPRHLSHGRCAVGEAQRILSSSLYVTGDQPGAALVGEVSPGPFENHHEAVAEPNQEEHVNK